MLNSCVMHRHTVPASDIMVWGGLQACEDPHCREADAWCGGLESGIPDQVSSSSLSYGIKLRYPPLIAQLQLQNVTIILKNKSRIFIINRID
ncbi:UNVERIFIED_CONTAM: hypothetical protein NCL1_26245 [Trichonephila clavipes]